MAKKTKATQLTDKQIEALDHDIKKEMAKMLNKITKKHGVKIELTVAYALLGLGQLLNELDKKVFALVIKQIKKNK